MLIAILTFGVIFLLFASGGLLLFYREAMLKRISEVIDPQVKKASKRSLLDTIQQTGSSLGGVVEHFEHVLPKSQAEVSVVSQRLIRAGYRNESAVKVFYGMKVLLPLLLVHPGAGDGTGAHAEPVLCLRHVRWGWVSWDRISGWEDRLPSGRNASRGAFPTCSICWSSASRPD